MSESRKLTSKEICNQAEIFTPPDSKPELRSTTLETRKIKHQIAADQLMARLEQAQINFKNFDEHKSNTPQITYKIPPYISNNIFTSKAPHQELNTHNTFLKMNRQVKESILCSYLSIQDAFNFSKSCVTLYKQSETARYKSTFLAYLQAILHDEPVIVFNILKSHPTFLFAKPEDFGITELKSRYTWYHYFTTGENTLRIAQKLQRFDVLRDGMMPHYQKKINDAREREDIARAIELEHAWMLQVPSEQEQKTLQQKYYKEIISPIEKALLRDESLLMQWTTLKKYHSVVEVKLYNGATYTALKNFRSKLLKPTTLDERIDINQLLLAAYNPYSNVKYSDLVVAFIESLVDPWIAKKLCEGMNSGYYKTPPFLDHKSYPPTFHALTNDARFKAILARYPEPYVVLRKLNQNITEECANINHQLLHPPIRGIKKNCVVS